MQFEDLVLRKAETFGLVYQKVGANLSLLWSSYATFDRTNRLIPGNNLRLRESVLDLATASYLFATKGDQTTVYIPLGKRDDFFSTLDPDLPVTFPPLQITQAVAEIQLGLFIPHLAPRLAWYRAQHLYLLCEHYYITLLRRA